MMRISYIFLLVNILTLSIVSGVVIASPVVEIKNYRAKVGELIEVPIVVNDAYNVAGGNVIVSFDNKIVEVKSVKSGDFGEPVANVQNDKGVVNIAVAKANSMGRDKANLAVIVFKAIGIGKTTLDISKAVLNDENGNLIAVKAISGSISISPPSTTTTVVTTISGKDYTFGGKFLEPPRVSLQLIKKEIKVGEQGILELSMYNPTVNNITLVCDLYIRVPPNVKVTGGEILSGGGGQYSATYEVKPGSSSVETIYLSSDEKGKYTIHAEVHYYPKGDKSDYRTITLNDVLVVPGFEAITSVVAGVLALMFFRHKRNKHN
jgi:hypothetical protein